MDTSPDSLKLTLFAEAPKAPPGVFVLFGATGDLTARKIAPALYNLYRQGRIGDDVAVVGVARRERSDDQFRQEMLQAVRQHSPSQPVDEALWRRWAPRWHYQVTHADSVQEFRLLADRLGQVRSGCGPGGGMLFYLASTPDTWPDILAGLKAAGLHCPSGQCGFCRVVLEKPYGLDLASARRLNQAVREVFPERQVFRIDHYLGKETAQNILVFRFANSVFEPLLDCRHVQSVQITAAETVGMEGRRGLYYEKVGAMRDMIQSHMLQLLALVAMEQPASVQAEGIRAAKARLLEALRPMTPEEVARWTVRGQYLGDEQAPAYRQELGVSADSRVETYAAVRVLVDNARWSGVPFYLRTGKRLAAKASFVEIQFRREWPELFQDVACDLAGPNRLLLRMSPDPGVAVVANAKVPGPRMLLRPVQLDFRYEQSFPSASPEAYERLILDALVGEAALFLRQDEVEASWRFVDTIREIWDNADQPELGFYPGGSWGPPQAEAVFGDPYQRWYNFQPR